MSIEGKLRGYFEFREKTTPTTAENISRLLKVGLDELTISDGSGDYQATKIWSYRESLAATSRTWDLTALPVSNVSGTGTGSPVQSLSKVKAILLLNEGTDGQILYLGNAASNAFCPFVSSSTARLLCMPGLPLILPNVLTQASAAWTVDASNKSLKIDAGAATITYTLALLGV